MLAHEDTKAPTDPVRPKTLLLECICVCVLMVEYSAFMILMVGGLQKIYDSAPDTKAFQEPYQPLRGI